MADFELISLSLQKGKADEVKELVSKALEESNNPKEVLEEGLIAGMSIIGAKFKRNEV